jgi:VanZ family protein
MIIIPVAIVEELLQLFFPTREFSFFDMGWGILGILTACILKNLYWRRLDKVKD